MALLLNVTGAVNVHAVIGTIDSAMRPSGILTVPALVTWENNSEAKAAGINISSNGNISWYGPTLANGNHIAINVSYLLP